MVSHLADQFDPLAGSEQTFEMVSGLPRRIAQARIRAAAALARDVLDRARTNPSDRGLSSARDKIGSRLVSHAAVQNNDDETFSCGAELLIMGVCFGSIILGLLVNLLH